MENTPQEQAQARPASRAGYRVLIEDDFAAVILELGVGRVEPLAAVVEGDCASHAVIALAHLLEGSLYCGRLGAAGLFDRLGRHQHGVVGIAGVGGFHAFLVFGGKGIGVGLAGRADERPDLHPQLALGDVGRGVRQAHGQQDRVPRLFT